jgi:hypothetical protein
MVRSNVERQSDGRRSGLMRNNGSMPLICPTCQNVFAGSLRTSTNLLLCMGLFSIFWSGARTAPGLRLSQDGLPSRSSRAGSPPSPVGLRRGSLHSLRERRLVGPAGLEPATRPL